MYDLVEKSTLFSITPQTKNPSLSPYAPYQKIDLVGTMYGSFAGGTCLATSANNCIVLTNTKGNVVVPYEQVSQIKASSYSFSEGITSFGITSSEGTAI